MTALLTLNGRLSLKHRQMIVVVGVSVIILLFTTGVFLYSDYVSLKRSISERIQSKANFIAASSVTALANRNAQSAQKVLKIASIDQSIQLAVLYDRHQSPLAEYRIDKNSIEVPVTVPPIGLSSNFDNASLVLPIVVENKTQGWLYLVYDLAELKEQVGIYAKIVMVIFIVGLILIWLLSSILQKFVLEPITRLAGLIDKISRTKNYSERVSVERSDELGALMKGFNTMLTAIQERESDLQRHNERMESLVELRTRQLHHRSNYDALTRLPNRYLLMEKLHQAIESARRTERKMALLLIDIDRFKIINDSLGHHLGDELLLVMSKRLSNINRIDDAVARLGGDEFVVLLGDVNRVEDAEFVAKKIMEELSEPFVLQHHRLHISVSIGISVFPDDADDALGLLRRADVSMYRSKQKGKNLYSFYDSELDDNSARLTIESGLRNALANSELYLVYQPQVCLKTNKVIGAEALMRWNNPGLGEVFPAEFIPIAVEIGIINELSIWAIESVCQQLRKWKDSRAPLVKTSINISAADLLMPDFVQTVGQIIEKYVIDPSYLQLEITEDVFLEGTDKICRALYQLKAMGILVAIDDFGTGYSSLSYLRDLPVDVLKLDGSFVQRIHESSKSRGIVLSAISLAHGLGLKIVAECVETQSQFSFLVDNGCDIVQGNYFSDTLVGHDFAVFLQQHSALQTPKRAIAI